MTRSTEPTSSSRAFPMPRYTASPENSGFADAYYVELTPDPDGKIVLFEEVAHWLSPDAPLEEGTDPYVAFARRHSERDDLTVEKARTIIRGLCALIEGRYE